ncbi:MAG: hypothetical protein Q7S57_03945 [bacterium]|nr:hypothetical protein [bacterium]
MPKETTPVAGKPVEKKPPTLKDIVDDKDLGRGFNVWLETQGKPELATKLVNKGELLAGDLDSLATAREQFQKRRTEAEEIKTGLGTKEALAGFIKVAPKELGRLAELTGEEGLREAMAATVEKIALAPGSNHEEFYMVYTKWVEVQKNNAEAQKAAAELLKDSHLSQNEALQVMMVVDPTLKKKEIERLLEAKGEGPKEETGFWLWKGKKWSKEQQELIEMNAAKFSDVAVPGETKSGLDKFTDVAALAVEVEAAEKSTAIKLGEFCSTSGSNEIGKVIMGEKLVVGKAMGFKEMKDEVAKLKNTEPMREEFYKSATASFADFVIEENFDLNNPAMLVSAREGFFETFAKQQKEKAIKDRGGVWAAVYKALIEPIVDEFLKDLEGNSKIDVPNKRLLPKKKPK